MANANTTYGYRVNYAEHREGLRTTSPTVRTISWTGAAKKFIRAVASKPLP